MHFESELKLLLMSQHSLLYVVTDEEERLEYTLRKIIEQELSGFMYYWDFIEGYHDNPNNAKKATGNPLGALEFIDNSTSGTSKFFILKDFHVFMNDISVIRKIKNIAKKLKNINCNIIISASEIQFPPLLKNSITVIEFPLPNVQEIQIELERLSKVLSINSSVCIRDLAVAYKGFTIDKIRRSVAKFISSQKSIDSITDCILEEKKQLIQQTDILEFYPCNNNLSDIGGLINLKKWLVKRSDAFSQQARTYGLPSPKGVLLVGIQGTGKSLSAKAISEQWKIPLLKLDVGKIFAGIIGESEKRMRRMIAISEQSAPCILWIDEIDKAFSRLNQSTDSGTTNRVLSSFLTWLSEKETQVFIVATANNISLLPAELVRKGRFDEIFFLDLPRKEERANIFRIHLMKLRPLSWKNFDLTHLSILTEGFSGAEIKQSILEAMHDAFYEKREFNTRDISNAIKEFIPLSFSDKSSISALQNWAKLGKVRLASDRSINN
uniref:Uncharacterized AAA domain-containing protein ycf46 n=1 Tax=Rhodymenia pseudopalmata TaxID=31502 RepID=A0A1C9C7R5_RHOPU|nr:hypothetical protein Rhodyp_135 [Rhodymenia pseudopalmata]AOM64413.1 hypothetical protein Rhodyp_135 [Rhodymenia pseudopalmata]